jgi:hypothetical protein
MNEHFDVIIIGSGASGGTLALKLAPSGKRILILERGDHLAREKQNWDTTEVFVKNRYVSKDTWYDKDGKPFQPGVHYFVGGATKMYGAALFRLREGDVTAHHTADGQTPDWPIRYEDMELHYTQAERLYNVHGQRGDDPTDPPASAPYPFQPVSHEPRIQEMADGLKRAGLHPAYAPTGIMLNQADMPNSRCIRCDTCDGFPCLIHANGDAEVIAVRPALQFPNVKLFTNAHVQKLETSASGREVTKVVVEHNGSLEKYSGSIVVVFRWRSQLGATAAEVRQRQTSARPGKWLGPSRPKLSLTGQTAKATIAVHAGASGYAPAPHPEQCLSGKTDSHRRRRPPIRHLSFRHRPEDFRARRELQGARIGQPLRRGHELFPEHRRGESFLDRHRQRTSGRRPFA